jgi:hypothetical protein
VLADALDRGLKFGKPFPDLGLVGRGQVDPLRRDRADVVREVVLRAVG